MWKSCSPHLDLPHRCSHAASQPQAVIDPNLEAEMVAAAVGPGESHFDSAIGDLTSGDLTGLDFCQDLTSPYGALASVWTATETT